MQALHGFLHVFIGAASRDFLVGFEKVETKTLGGEAQGMLGAECVNAELFVNVDFFLVFGLAGFVIDDLILAVGLINAVDLAVERDAADHESKTFFQLDWFT